MFTFSEDRLHTKLSISFSYKCPRRIQFDIAYGINLFLWLRNCFCIAIIIGEAYALYREKALRESCQVLVEHAQRVTKIQLRT